MERKELQSLGIAEALPGLWIGNRNAAAQLGVLKKLNIGSCVNCTDDQHMHPSHFRYYHVAVQDSESVDIVQHVPNLVPWIKRQMSSGEAVLVYCHMGVSRSCTIIIALILHLRPTWSLMQAWEHVKSVRKQVKPNGGFLKQLVKLEYELRGENSVQVVRNSFKRSATAPSSPLSSARVV